MEQEDHDIQSELESYLETFGLTLPTGLKRALGSPDLLARSGAQLLNSVPVIHAFGELPDGEKLPFPWLWFADIDPDRSTLYHFLDVELLLCLDLTRPVSSDDGVDYPVILVEMGAPSCEYSGMYMRDLAPTSQRWLELLAVPGHSWKRSAE